MLQVDPEKRISLSHIAHHPWMRDRDGWQNLSAISIENTHCEGKHNPHVDTAIAKDICESMGLEMEYLKKIILERQIGPTYVTYRLTEKSKNRNPRKIPVDQNSIRVYQTPLDSDMRFQMPILEHRLPIPSTPSQFHHIGKRHATMTIPSSSNAYHPLDLFADTIRPVSPNNTLQTADVDSIKENVMNMREIRVFSDSPRRSPCPDIGLTLVNGVFDVEIVSSKDPERMMKAMISAVIEREVEFEYISEYILRCFVEDKLRHHEEVVIFEMELCRIRSLPLNGIRFRQISGSLSIYHCLFPDISQSIQTLLN